MRSKEKALHGSRQDVLFCAEGTFEHVSMRQHIQIAVLKQCKGERPLVASLRSIGNHKMCIDQILYFTYKCITIFYIIPGISHIHGRTTSKVRTI